MKTKRTSKKHHLDFRINSVTTLIYTDGSCLHLPYYLPGITMRLPRDWMRHPAWRLRRLQKTRNNSNFKA